MKRLLSIFLVILLVPSLVACNSGTTSSDDELDAVRQYASSYSELVNGRACIYSLVGMLSYYNEATYQEAKSEAKVSKQVQAQYFPSVHWEGSEFLSSPLISRRISDIYVCSLTDSAITFIFQLSYEPVDGLPASSLYKAVYSVNSNEITDIVALCTDFK